MKNMNSTVLLENDQGIIYRYNKIPNNLLNFYMLKKRAYKNGNDLWHLCIEVATPPSSKKGPDCCDTTHNYIKLESFRGTKSQAKARLDEIIKEYM